MTKPTDTELLELIDYARQMPARPQRLVPRQGGAPWELGTPAQDCVLGGVIESDGEIGPGPGTDESLQELTLTESSFAALGGFGHEQD
jgi:hypothetical protein